MGARRESAEAEAPSVPVRQDYLEHLAVLTKALRAKGYDVEGTDIHRDRIRVETFDGAGTIRVETLGETTWFLYWPERPSRWAPIYHATSNLAPVDDLTGALAHIISHVGCGTRR